MDEAELEFSSVPDLQEFDNVLRCGICHEIIKTPVILSCSHTFCSLCIRKWLSTKQVCPACSEEVRESSLRRNPMVENIIDALCNLKKKLQKRNCQSSPAPASRKTSQPQSNSRDNKKSAATKFDNNDSDSDSDFMPKKTPPITPKMKSKEKLTTSLSSSSSETPQRNIKRLPVNPLSSPSLQTPQRNVKEKQKLPTSAVLQSPRLTTSPAPATPAPATPAPATPAPTGPKVACPVCSQLMPEAAINTHLDKCLAGESTSSSSSNQRASTIPNTSSQRNGLISKTVLHSSPGMSQSMPKTAKKSNERSSHALEPIKKMVYNLLKDAQLKKELKKYGLSTTGDRTALLSRLNRYVVMHNAECDATNPRSIEELRKAFDKEDKSLTAPPSNSFSKLFSTKQPNPDDFDKHRTDYIKQNKNSYDALIEEVRRRNQQKKESKSTTSEHVASTSVAARSKVDAQSVSSPDEKTPKPQKNGIKDNYKMPVNHELSSSDDDYTSEGVKAKMLGVKKKIIEPVVIDSSDSEIDYSPLGKDSPVKRHTDSDSDNLTPEISGTPLNSTREKLNVKRKVQCIESESDDNAEKCSRPEKRASLEGRSPVLSRKTPVRRELRSRAPQSRKVPNNVGPATRRSQRNVKTNEEETPLEAPSPDIFGTPKSSASSDIPCGQPKRKSADSDDDALSQLVSLINDGDDASDSGSTTDFED